MQTQYVDTSAQCIIATISKEWSTIEDHNVYILQHGKECSNVYQQTTPIALAVMELCLSGSISKLLSHSVENPTNTVLMRFL